MKDWWYHPRRTTQGICRTGIRFVPILLALIRCTEYLTPPQPPTGYPVQVTDLRAVYDVVRDRVNLLWSRPVSSPDEPLSFYVLHRWRKDAGGRLVDSVRRWIDSAAVSYVDVLDLLKDSVFYSIVAARVVGLDTLFGPPSPSAATVAGIGVTFTINNGAMSTGHSRVTLQLVDINGYVDSIQVTQKVNRYFSKGSDRVSNMSTLVVQRLTDADIAALVARGFYNANTKQLTDGVSPGEEPIFDGLPDPASPDNPVRPMRLWAAPGDTNHIPWVLSPGKEDKRVFVRVWARIGGAPIVKTLSYGLPIAPYRIRPRIENRRMVFYPAVNPDDERREGPSDATVIFTHTEGSEGLTAYDEYIFTGRTVRFTLRIDEDSTIDPEFEYWLVFPREANRFTQSNHGLLSVSYHWVETVRRRGRLTGIGALHDESFVYEYSIDTTTEDGRQNLASLRIVANTIGYPYVNYVDTITDSTPAANYRLVTAMLATPKVISGKKEFFLAFRFRGRFFHDERYVLFKNDIYDERYVLTSGLTRRIYSAMFFDVCPPKITMLSPNVSGYINNGDTVSAVFDYRLDAASVEDGGKARVTDVKLVIAKSPAPGYVTSRGQVWADTSWNYRQFKLDQHLPLTLEDLYRQDVVVLRYPLRLPWRVIKDVVWRGIDATAWPAGKYFVAIVTRDEYGNEGLAPVNWYEETRQTNPFQIYVASGR